MQNNIFLRNTVRKWLFPLLTIILYLISLSLPYFRLSVAYNYSGWRVFVLNSMRFFDANSVGGNPKPLIALGTFLILLLGYFLSRKHLKKSLYLVAIVTLLVVSYMVIQIFLPAFFVGGTAAALAVIRILGWGYFLSTFLAFVIAFWMFWDIYKMEKESSGIQKSQYLGKNREEEYDYY